MWCHASAWYFPMASHLSEKNPKGSPWPRRSCMICPIPPRTWSSTLPCSIPGFPNTSGFTAPPPAPQGLCTVCLLCLEHSLSRYLWAPSHLSGLCSNISIWVKPLKNSLKGIISSPHALPLPSTKLSVPWGQDFFYFVLRCNPSVCIMPGCT